MTTKSEKSAQIKSVIIEALDDLAAAVDGFAKRLDSIDSMLLTTHDRLTEIDTRLLDLKILEEANTRKYDDLDNTVRCINDAVEDQRKYLEKLEENFSGIDTMAQEIRSRELNDMRFDARAAMGKVKFVRVQ